MGQSFKFCILQASPDPRRGERINVGLAVFRSDNVDVRMPELRKLRALAGRDWNEAAGAYDVEINRLYADNRDIDGALSHAREMSKVFIPSDTGLFVINSASEYEERVNSIVDTLIAKVYQPRTERQPKINTEISHTLAAAEVLAKRKETIDDHKVVRNFVVSHDKELVADFAYKNGALRIVATLDMRSAGNFHGKACEKGATLHFARKAFGKTTRTLAVYAVPPVEAHAHSAEIGILQDFSEGGAFNWLDAGDQQKFRRLLY